MNGYIVFLSVMVAYAAVLILGNRRGFWKMHRVSLLGPVVMIRTLRGRRLMERLAGHTRFWKAYGWLSVSILVGSSIAVVVVLLWRTLTELGPSAPDDGAEEIGIAQRGISPLITLLYLGIGLVVAVVVHELAHGIQAIVGRIRLDSLGVLLLVVPIGAFVEPNDEDLRSASRRLRRRLYSAGPATNMLFALALFALFTGLLAPSAKPVSEGAIVTDLVQGSPADLFGIPIWSSVVEVNGIQIKDGAQLEGFSFFAPGEPARIKMIYRNQMSSLEVPGGVVVTEVPDGPALNAGIKPGMIIRSLNHSVIHNMTVLRSVIEISTHDAPVNISVLKYRQDPDTGVAWFFEDESIRSINLTSKWLYYYTHWPFENREEYKNMSYMAASFATFGLKVEDPDYLTRLMAEPFEGAEGFRENAEAGMRLLALPLIGYSPIVPPASDLYEPTGTLASLPQDWFWVLVNVVYWMFWANIMVGLANSLPALPFDGGLVVRDAMKGLARISGKRLSGLDRAVGKRPPSDDEIDSVMLFVSTIVGLLLLAVVIGQLV